MPELRAGNATVNAAGARRSPRCRRRRPPSASGCRSMPRRASRSRSCAPARRRSTEARYGPLRARVLSLERRGPALRQRGGQGRRGLRRASRLARRDRGRAGDAAARRAAAVAHRRPPARRRRLRARRGAARAPVGSGGNPRAGPRPPGDLRRRARGRGRPARRRPRGGRSGAPARRSSRSTWPTWVARCAALPRARIRLAGRDARASAPGLDTPGCTTQDGGSRSWRCETAARIAPHRPAPPPPAALVARVREALAP